MICEFYIAYHTLLAIKQNKQISQSTNSYLFAYICDFPLRNTNSKVIMSPCLMEKVPKLTFGLISNFVKKHVLFYRFFGSLFIRHIQRSHWIAHPQIAMPSFIHRSSLSFMAKLLQFDSSQTFLFYLHCHLSINYYLYLIS